MPRVGASWPSRGSQSDSQASMGGDQPVPRLRSDHLIWIRRRRRSRQHVAFSTVAHAPMDHDRDAKMIAPALWWHRPI